MVHSFVVKSVCNKNHHSISKEMEWFARKRTKISPTFKIGNALHFELLSKDEFPKLLLGFSLLKTDDKLFG